MVAQTNVEILRTGSGKEWEDRIEDELYREIDTLPGERRKEVRNILAGMTDWERTRDSIEIQVKINLEAPCFFSIFIRHVLADGRVRQCGLTRSL